MRHHKIRHLAAALIASTIMTTALPVCAADMNASDQTAVSAETTAQDDNTSDYVTENGIRVIKDDKASAYVYDGGKSGVIIVEDPISLWKQEKGLTSIGGVALSDIISYNKGYIEQIRAYQTFITPFYDYSVDTYGSSGEDFQGLSFKFMDMDLDIYSLHFNDTINARASDDNYDIHKVCYNSKQPAIVRIDWEFT